MRKRPQQGHFAEPYSSSDELHTLAYETVSLNPNISFNRDIASILPRKCYDTNRQRSSLIPLIYLTNYQYLNSTTISALERYSTYLSREGRYREAHIWRSIEVWTCLGTLGYERIRLSMQKSSLIKQALAGILQ